jgi:hypothetical protein
MLLTCHFSVANCDPWVVYRLAIMLLQADGASLSSTPPDDVQSVGNLLSDEWVGFWEGLP